ncbi:MAG: cell division protein FtsA [Parcubacteria group bacterium]|nr:cell division protein FtsA [Parcubacteria group bacterium]
MAQNVITGLDIGSNSVKAVVLEVKKNGKFSVVAAVKKPSAGMRKGAVSDIADCAASVSRVFAELKEISRDALRNVFLGIGDAHVKAHVSRGIIAVSRADNEIYKDDIERVGQTAQTMLKLSPNRTVIHNIPREYIVDGVGGVSDPLGMIGGRLEADCLIIDAFSPAVKNLMRCVEEAGGGVSGVIFNPIASGRSILTKNQKDLGTVLIDVGFGVTGMVVFEEGKIVHAAVFPVGAGNITNDLAIGLKVSVETAERIKLLYGHALSGEVSHRDKVNLSKIDEGAKGEVSRRFISEIIEGRLAEILEFVNNELKIVGRAGRLPAGAVIVGGGAKIPGMVEVAKQELRLPIQIGIPDLSGLDISDKNAKDDVEDPEFTTALGLAAWGADGGDGKMAWPSGIKEFIRKVLKNLLP